MHDYGPANIRCDNGIECYSLVRNPLAFLCNTLASHAKNKEAWLSFSYFVVDLISWPKQSKNVGFEQASL
jgi:hypothetical protein